FLFARCRFEAAGLLRQGEPVVRNQIVHDVLREKGDSLRRKRNTRSSLSTVVVESITKLVLVVAKSISARPGKNHIGGRRGRDVRSGRRRQVRSGRTPISPRARRALLPLRYSPSNRPAFFFRGQ